MQINMHFGGPIRVHLRYICLRIHSVKLIASVAFRNAQVHLDSMLFLMYSNRIFFYFRVFYFYLCLFYLFKLNEMFINRNALLCIHVTYS